MSKPTYWALVDEWGATRDSYRSRVEAHAGLRRESEGYTDGYLMLLAYADGKPVYDANDFGSRRPTLATRSRRRERGPRDP